MPNPYSPDQGVPPRKVRPVRRSKVIFDEVRAAQAQLGVGEVDESLARAGGLREEARRMLVEKRDLTSFDRDHLRAAVTYATLTMVLATAESAAPAVAIPRIRELTRDILAADGPGVETWKVLAAAGEMLARAGDAEGAVWAVKKARSLGQGGDYVVQVAGGIQSMYPQAYAGCPDDPSDEPPPFPGPGARR